MNKDSLRVPAFCPLCEFLMKGKSTSTYYEHGVCISCFIQFVEGREQRWKEGWRPSKEELDYYIKNVILLDHLSS